MYFLLFLLFLLIFYIKDKYKPRLDITHEGDLILWYNNTKKERVFKILLKLY